MVQSMRAENRQDIMCGNSSHSRSMTEPEGKPNGRRRTQVACQRCRQRKIKCSGDTGDGHGCTNCRTSGTRTCMFLRVNSSVLHAPYVTLPFPAFGSNGALSTGGLHQGSYDQHALSRPSSAALHSTSTSCAPYSLFHHSFDYGANNGSNFAHRPPYVSGYSLGYDNDTAYQAQQQQSNMLTNGDVAGGNASGSTAGSKPWYESCQAKSLPGMFTDPDMNNSITGPGYPFILQQPHTPAPTDNVSTFPLLSSQPAGITSSDRILPNPVGHRNSTFSPVTAVSESSANASAAPGQISNYKSSWAFDKHFVNDFHVPRADSSAMSSTTSSGRSRLSPSSPSDIGFGYMPISSNQSTPALISPSSTLPEILSFSDRYHSADESRRPKASHRESFPETYTSEMYGYSRGRHSRGTLISGHVYVRNPADSEPLSIHRPDSIPRPAPLSPLTHAEGI
ncbi:uncharacterized protein CIMG_07764 [Coccidioides immitis RS]|uniref:uncharacterized protein n=1 Tax=Coccidioides immitis (strain RS) TaxID=246410 RepID=UPI00027D19B2|nr:uncharacterized protein CIMG_07764 [Coccidioides immitis RS]EAS29018.3 hypothetical protein CIMG_07764 [Coccidioides immitis RS]TPX22821.1 hypothetical protein DIZ76_014700 [Coccidioides immitis]